MLTAPELVCVLKAYQGQVLTEKDYAVLAKHGLGTEGGEISSKGKAWVTAILAVPCPREAFVDSYGEVVGYRDSLEGE